MSCSPCLQCRMGLTIAAVSCWMCVVLYTHPALALSWLWFLLLILDWLSLVVNRNQNFAGSSLGSVAQSKLRRS